MKGYNMSRNLKRENLKKLAAIQTSNGYKIDLANYVYNPNLMYEYPSLTKIMGETEEARTISTIYYFKYYNGGGEYLHRIHEEPKENASTWYVVKDKTETVLETSNRFNLNKLIKYAEEH